MTDYTETDDGDTWQQGAMLISVANGQSIGGGMRITPDARLDDGMLDLFVVESTVQDPASWPFSPRVFSGRPRRASGGGASDTCTQGAAVPAGTLWPTPTASRIGPLPLSIEVDPGAVRILA